MDAKRLALHTFASAVVLAGVAWVATQHIQPLTEPPEPPPGVHIAWAGQPIRGYAETVTTTVADCAAPADINVALYPAVGRPWTPPTAGLVALSVS